MKKTMKIKSMNIICFFLLFLGVLFFILMIVFIVKNKNNYEGLEKYAKIDFTLTHGKNISDAFLKSVLRIA